MTTQPHRTDDTSEIYAMVSFNHKEHEGERNSSFFAFAYSGMVDAANVIDPDIRIEWHGPHAWDPVPEIEVIQALTASQVHGIMVTAADKKALDESINAALQAGIPVINFDADSPASERLALVSTDNYKAGYLAGITMAEWLGGRGDVAVSTIEQADHLIERLRGFKDALSQYAPKTNVYVSYDSGNIDVDASGQQDFTEYRQNYIRLMQAYPKIRGLFATYAIPGAGAAEAVEELGLRGKVQILAFDFDEIIIKLVETDKIRATVGQDAYMMGYASMILLHAARHASSLPAKAAGGWRAPALAEFLAAHSQIHKNTAARLRAIIARLEGTGADKSGLIDTGARILGKLELLDILAEDFEDMRNSISEKIEFLGRQVEVRKQAERALRRLNEELERRVQEREQQVRTSTEVSQEIAAASDLNELFRRVVTLIKERFNFYHVQIFRYDPALDAVVLVTGYGEAGQHMLADGHRLAMGRGVVGTAAASGQSILATDVAQDAAWRPNPHLPETRGELVVPIKLRDKVLGILDVQSDRAGALTADDRLLLEGLCGQIASAMDSTRLLEEQRRSQAELSQALQIAKLAYWEYDVAKDRFLFNDQFFSLFHTTAAQEGGYQLSSAQYAGKFVYPEDLPVVGTEIERALNSTDRHYSRDVVHRIQYADGGVGYMSVSINIDRDEQGHILRYYGANQDITDRQLVEADLEKFKLGLERSSSAIFITDPQGVISYVNPAFEKIYGYTREEAIGNTPRIFKSGVVPPEQYQQFWSTLLHGQTAAGEIINKTKDGRLIPIDGSNNPILDQNGHVVGFLGMHTDITARKQIELALRYEQSLMQSLMTTITDRIYFKDREGRFLRASRSVATQFGLSDAEQIIGKSDFDFFTEEHARPAYEDEQEIMRTGQPKTVEERETFPDRPDTWARSTKMPLRDENGDIVGTFGFSIDITERKQAEVRLQELLEEVQQSERLMHTLIDTLPDSIYAKDTQSRFTLANLTEIHLNGVTSFDELRGKNDFDRYPRELAEQYFADEQPILRDGIALIDHEERGLDNKGNPRWHLSTKVPLRDSQGNIVGLVGTTRDITASKHAASERERLLLEQQKRALQLQTASEVSRAASSILNVDELLSQAVELIRARFGFYYVGIFLNDEARQQTVLRAGTGEAGQQMLANRHHLEIGGASMIGQCIVHQQADIALDVGDEAIRFSNPLLPLTRSEMALPLISRGLTIGAMTIQSDQPAAFTADDITALQSMADQISNAVENARLYEQAQAALADTEQLLQASAELNVAQTYDDVLAVVRKYTILGQEAQTIAINVFDRPWIKDQPPAWIELIGYYTRRSSRMDLGTRFPISVFSSAHSLLRPDAPTTIEDLDTAQLDPNTRALFVQRLGSKSVIFVPLVVGGQWFGYMNVLYPQPARFNEIEVRRLESMVGQAAVAVQSLRALAAAQQTLTETETSYRATQAIGRAQSIEAILEATTPVIDFLGMTRATLRLAARRDISDTVLATDLYAYHRRAGQWILQPVLKDIPASDSATLKALQRNPETVVIYTDALDPNTAMPDDVRRALLDDQLRSVISTSVSVQNEVLGFLSFSGPQILHETAEQRLRLTIRALSDQVAVAVQNRLRFEQTRAALEEVDSINRRLTGETWDTYLHQQTRQAVIRAADDDLAAPPTLELIDAQLTAGEIIFEPDPDDHSEATVTAPILLRGQPIGALRMRTPMNTWDKDAEALLTDIASHIAQAVENARLIEQTQRTASRERAINEINARVRQTIDLDTILRTAVNELGQSLKAARVTARINAADTDRVGAADSPRGTDHD